MSHWYKTILHEALSNNSNTNNNTANNNSNNNNYWTCAQVKRSDYWTVYTLLWTIVSKITTIE